MTQTFNKTHQNGFLNPQAKTTVSRIFCSHTKKKTIKKPILLFSNVSTPLEKWKSQNCSLENIATEQKGFSVKTIKKPKFASREKSIKALISYSTKVKNHAMNSKQVSIECKQYYECLFQEVDFKKLLKRPRRKTDFNKTQVNKLCQRFSDTVFNRDKMIIYLQTTPGLYARLCLWAIQNPCPNTGCLKQKHHIVPRFLKNYGIAEEIINKPYNIACVDLMFHFLLHAVRLLEYRQYEDYNSVGYIIGSAYQATYKVAETDDWSNLYTDLHSDWSLKILDCYPEIKVYQRQNASKGGRIGANTTISKAKRDILTRSTIWKHIKYKNHNTLFWGQESTNSLPLTVTISAQMDPLSVRDFLKCLINKLPNSDPKREHYLNNLTSGNRILSSYLNGQNGHDTLYGFVLQNPSPDSLIIKRSVPGQPKTNKEINRMKIRSDPKSLYIVEKENFILKHIQGLHIPIIMVKPNQFVVLSDLVKHVFNTYNNYKKPNQPQQKCSSTQIDNLIRFIKSQLLTDEKYSTYAKCKTCYGWTVERI